MSLQEVGKTVRILLLQKVSFKFSKTLPFLSYEQLFTRVNKKSILGLGQGERSVKESKQSFKVPCASIEALKNSQICYCRRISMLVKIFSTRVTAKVWQLSNSEELVSYIHNFVESSTGFFEAHCHTEQLGIDTVRIITGPKLVFTALCSTNLKIHSLNASGSYFSRIYIVLPRVQVEADLSRRWCEVRPGAEYMLPLRIVVEVLNFGCRLIPTTSLTYPSTEWMTIVAMKSVPPKFFLHLLHFFPCLVKTQKKIRVRHTVTFQIP